MCPWPLVHLYHQCAFPCFDGCIDIWYCGSDHGEVFEKNAIYPKSSQTTLGWIKFIKKILSTGITMEKWECIYHDKCNGTYLV
jgi:hypothetical protein